MVRLGLADDGFFSVREDVARQDKRHEVLRRYRQHLQPDSHHF